MDTLVLGIGNVLWADEGFGVRAVAALNEGWRFPESVTLMDGGTQGLYLLPHVQAARRILVFDAIDYGLEPGTLQIVRDDEIPHYIGVGKMSLHQSSFQEVLSLAQLSGHTPEKAVLVGVQPKLLKDFGGSLTDVVREKLPEALALGLGFLAEWGVPVADIHYEAFGPASVKLPGVQGLRIDVLAPGARLGSTARVPALAWAAQATRFAWHKLYSSTQRRGFREKAAKDQQQALVLAAILAESDPLALRLAFAEAENRLAGMTFNHGIVVLIDLLRELLYKKKKI